MIHSFLRHIGMLYTQEDGNTVTEYAVMLSLIVLGSIIAIASLGNKITQIFQSVAQIG
jgi:Flp pilus assembly pilin Flp